MDACVAIIGGGNLGKSIAFGLLKAKITKAENIMVTRRKLNLLQDLSDCNVQITSNNIKAVSQAKVIILTVKPYQVAEVLSEIKPFLTPNHVLISSVTGVSLAEIQNQLGLASLSIYRAMPNTSIAVGESMTCISKTASAHDDEKVAEIFDALGKTVWIEDALMDAATVLAACGTAYAMRFIRANIQGGIEIGFDAKTASLIAAQTVKGAAELLLNNETHPEQEIDKVTTPKGCTIAGLNEMEHQGFSSSLIRGVVASYRKIKE